MRRALRRLWPAGWAAALAALLGVAILVPRATGPPAQAYAAPDTDVVSRAIAFFEGRLRVDPTNGLVAGALAARYLRRFQLTADMSDVARAEELLRGAIPLAADRAETWADLAGVLLARHAFAEAHEAARRAVAADSGNAGAWAALFDASLAAGRYSQAEQALMRLPPGSVGRKVRVAIRLDAWGRAEEAYRTLRAACEEVDSGVPHPLSVAWCRTELGGLAETAFGARAAARHYAWALEAVPGYRGAIEGLANQAHARGDWVEAERLYRRIAADAHADLYLRLAEASAARRDAGGARRWEREFLRSAAGPGGEALHAHALALYLMERPETRDQALDVALRDVARRPTVESWDVLAWVRFRRGELEEALAVSNRVFGWGAPSPTMEYHRARILAAIGASEEAERLLASALAEPALLEPHVRMEQARRRG